MRRVKTYLRATMKQEGLNHLLLLCVHKELTDNFFALSWPAALLVTQNTASLCWKVHVIH